MAHLIWRAWRTGAAWRAVMTRTGSPNHIGHLVAASVTDLSLAVLGEPPAAASSNPIGPGVRASAPTSPCGVRE
jgi:hypothetical protein